MVKKLVVVNLPNPTGHPAFDIFKEVSSFELVEVSLQLRLFSGGGNGEESSRRERERDEGEEGGI